MKKLISFIIFTLFLGTITVLAQNSSNDDLPRFEVGVQTTSFKKLGIGGRFTYNLNRHVALEAESNFFRMGFNGTVTQALFGVKAGRRFNKFGVFAKARPGFVYEPRGKAVYTRRNDVNSNCFPYDVSYTSDTKLAADVGGVVEYYASKRILLRFDAGNTILRTGDRTIIAPFPFINPTEYRPTTIKSTLTNTFQISAGVSFRF